MRTADELWQLFQQADDMPYGAAQIALFEQLLPHVDAAGDPDLAFTARLWATTAYVYGGEPVKAFVTFAWCVSDFDRNPAPYHARGRHSLFWLFKTMVNAMIFFPEVPLERTHAVLDDMERRYREGGHSLQAVYKHRYQVADHVGRPDEADRWYARWQATPRDELSDCVGCDPTSVADYLASRERYADVVAMAEPVLAGELTCTEQPQGILRELMMAYLRTGEPEKAADAHRRAYRRDRGNLADLWDIGTHIGFCARTGNEHRGLEILQRHIDWLERAPSPGAEMQFAADAALLLRRLTELGHGDVRIHQRDRGERTAAELAGEMATRARELARRFDARNGTEHQSRRIEAEINAEPYGVDLVLSPSSRGTPALRAQTSVPRPEPLPGIPAGLGAAELLDLAREHAREDRHAALVATLDECDARFGDLSDPLLAGRRLVLRGDVLLDGSGDTDDVIAVWEQAAVLFAAAGAHEQLLGVRSRIALERAEQGEADEAPILAEVHYQEEHGGPLERASAWARLGNLRWCQERFDESIEAADRARGFAELSGRPRLVATTELLRSRALAAAHRQDEARTAARLAWEFYRDHGPAVRRAAVATVYGQLVEDPAEQVTVFGEALAGAGPGPGRGPEGGGVHGASGWVLAARVGRARALLRLDRAAEAIGDLLEAVAICDEQAMPEGSAYARQDLANAYRLAGRIVEAAEVSEEALLRFERLGLEEPANDVRFLLAGLYPQLGDAEGALTLYRELLARLPDNPAGRGQIGERLGGLLYDRDRDAEAAEAFASAAAALHESGDLIGELRVLRRRVCALHYADQPAAGEETARMVTERFEALPAELSREPNAIWQRAMTAFETGRLRMARGRHAEAVPDLRAAVLELQKLGATGDADRLDGMLGEALLRSGSPVEAQAVLRALLDRLPADADHRPTLTEAYAEAVRAVKERRRSGRPRRPWST